ncbi:MAG: hypothetical protein ACTSRG_07405 [Candidatus Helarchaeota archaeon]
MKILSVKKGFNTDHSTRSYGYIDGIKLYYDYGEWIAKFSIIYNTELYKKLKDFGNIGESIRKKFNKIIIELTMYSEEIGDDEYEWADLVSEIKEETEKHNLEPLEVIEAYYSDEKKFKSMKTNSKLGKKLQKYLTPI